MDSNSSNLIIWKLWLKLIELIILFTYSYQTSDGTSHQAEGHATNVGAENEGIAVKGSYKWIDADKHEHVINYIADENGFQPQGEDLPVGPVESH